MIDELGGSMNAQKYNSKTNLIWILCAIFFLIGLSIYRSQNSIDVSFTGDVLSAAGPEQYSFSADFSEIDSIALIPLTDITGKEISFKIANHVIYGDYTDSDGTILRICALDNIDTAIQARLKDCSYIILNYESDETTQSVFESLQEILESDY